MAWHGMAAEESPRRFCHAMPCHANILPSQATLIISLPFIWNNVYQVSASEREPQATQEHASPQVAEGGAQLHDRAL